MLCDLPLTLLYHLSFPEGAKFHSISGLLHWRSPLLPSSFFLFWLHCETCVILVPWLGIKPRLLAIEAWSLNHWTAREVPSSASFHKLSPYHHSVLRLNVSSSERSWRATKCKEGSYSLSMKGEMLVTQSCPTLYNPKDRSLPGSSVHGILQARVLDWVAIPFSRGSSRSRDWTQVSCIAGRFFTVWATRKALGITLLYFVD